MKRWILPSMVLVCLLAMLPSSARADEKADKDAAKRAAREAERARVQAERQRAEQERQARREADRQRKEARKQSAGSRDSGSASIRTQRETADSMDEQLRRKSLDKEKEAASSRDSKESGDEDEKATDPLAAIDEEIRAEDKRHADAASRYRKAIAAARRSRDANAVRDAEVALAREDETHRKVKESLLRRREAMSKEAPEKETPAKEEPVRKAADKEAPRRR